MSRRKGRAPRGAEIYGWTLFPTTPTDAFGRFMCGNLRNRLGRELWESREAAREAIVAELGANWPVRHWCVAFWQATRREPREESPHYVLCLACMWLGSPWNARDAFVLARQHALDHRADPEQVTDLQIRAWQRGDADPCWLSPRAGRHHAHSERDPHSRLDFAVCVVCGWRSGSYDVRSEADGAAWEHMSEIDGPPKQGPDGYPARGDRCPRPFPQPAWILRSG